MKKLPYGISNYEKLVEDGYYYVDKTRYIEKIEKLAEPNIMFLRPRKFGKTLFTSVLENYYDILKADKFDRLFGETYIGKNPTENKNSYYILRFNFSGISTESVESTIQGFKSKVASSIQLFVERYGLEFYINSNQEAEEMLDSLTSGFNVGKDITQDERFNAMMGFTKEELLQLMERQEIREEEREMLIPIMKENYDGYKFSISATNNVYNSNMCLYLLTDYVWKREIPEKLVDMNIASDYNKLGKMLDLCKCENRIEVIEKTISGEGIVTEITQKFNPEI